MCWALDVVTDVALLLVLRPPPADAAADATEGRSDSESGGADGARGGGTRAPRAARALSSSPPSQLARLPSGRLRDLPVVLAPPPPPLPQRAALAGKDVDDARGGGAAAAILQPSARGDAAAAAAAGGLELAEGGAATGGHIVVEGMLQDAAAAMRDSPDCRQLLRTSVLILIALVFHNLPEGLATFVGYMSSPRMGVTIAIAIAVHNIPGAPTGLCFSLRFRVGRIGHKVCRGAADTTKKTSQ